MARYAQQERIARVAQTDGKVAGKTLAVLDQPREPLEIKHNLKVLGQTLDRDMQRSRSGRLASDDAAAPSHDTSLLSNGKLDRYGALVEMLKAIAWHKEVMGRRSVSLESVPITL